MTREFFVYVSDISFSSETWQTRKQEALTINSPVKEHGPDPHSFCFKHTTCNSLRHTFLHAFSGPSDSFLERYSNFGSYNTTEEIF